MQQLCVHLSLTNMILQFCFLTQLSVLYKRLGYKAIIKYNMQQLCVHLSLTNMILYNYVFSHSSQYSIKDKVTRILFMQQLCVHLSLTKMILQFCFLKQLSVLYKRLVLYPQTKGVKRKCAKFISH